MLPCWEHYTRWQNKAMKTLIDENHYDVIFSHIHNVDICAHVFYRLAIYRKHDPEVEIERYPGFMERLYADVDRYLGEFRNTWTKATPSLSFPTMAALFLQ